MDDSIKVITGKPQHNAENECINGMWQRALIRESQRGKIEWWRKRVEIILDDQVQQREEVVQGKPNILTGPLIIFHSVSVLNNYG